MKKIATQPTIVLPLLAAGLLAGVAEAASSGVRVHRIGDAPLPPRNIVIVGSQAAVADAPAARPTVSRRREEINRSGHAVPLAPVGEEVGSAPMIAMPPVAPVASSARRQPSQVPLAPMGYDPQPQQSSAVSYAPAVTPVRQSSLPLAPVGYVAAPAPAPAPQPVVVPTPAVQQVPVAPQPVVAKPAPPVAAPPAAAPAPAPKPQPRRRLPIAPVVDDGSTALPPVPAALVR